ncbi:DNA polymerase III subunit gamma/tau [Cryomorphaceae bacterium 1068]|nr:DNA polymerase III subunit gamma/tau [Cryomorphaceae bacterium 1068]
MDEFIVSARKYRPNTFESVVGQENITQTLLKAIENNHLAQAFLFNGPRGVGKTTCARILAREVNHFHSEGIDEGNDFSFNIFELDAASNNSVEDIRSLIDQVRIPPQIGKYKVYIIDEVHMLSKAAFNAFLKTLEEPPSYAIFILATTEKHKVLPTIISRCQVFDFNRIQISSMVAHLAQIAEKEHIFVEESALHVISEKADGALRDALSIFDQMVSFSGNNVTYQDVIDNLNILDYDYYFALCNCFLNSDTETALVTFNQILNKGFDGHNFINGLANHIRNLLMCISPKTVGILEVGETIKQRYIEEAPKFETGSLVTALELLGKADLDYKISRNQRLLAEVLLLRLCALFSGSGEKKNSNDEFEVAPAKPGSKKDNDLVVAIPEIKESASPKNPPPTPAPVEEVSPVEKPVAEKIETPKEQIEEVSIAHTIETAPTEEKKPEPLPLTVGNGVQEPKPAPSGFSSKLGKGKMTGLPSISAMKEKLETKDEKTDTDPTNEAASYEGKPADAFNLNELWDAWKEYASKIKAEDKQSYYVTLTKHDPVMVEENQIEFLVDNHVQVSDLNEDKANLLEFLREKLNNWRILLNVVIDETETKDGDSLYDPSAKFEAMAEKNPLLKELRSRFDLDIDHDV